MNIAVYAEKPDVAIKIAVSLSEFKLDNKVINIENVEKYKKQIEGKYAKQGYIPIKYDSNNLNITWGKGHMCELKQAYDYNEDYKNWSNMPIPFIPENYEIKIKNRYDFKTKKILNEPDPWATKQLKIVRELFNSSDLIINATDYDREGEVIFGYVYEMTGSNVDYKRVKLDSMTESGIRKSFENLEPKQKAVNLEMAGRGRAIADWVVGANLTAIMSLKFATQQNPLISVGRVQTPTLKLIVDREKAIQNFKSEPFWGIKAHLSKAGEEFTATHKEKRFDKKEQATNIIDKIKDKNAKITLYEKKESKRNVPLLYNLTTLSMDANSKIGLTAADTLKVVQGLYEKGYVTYPRTSSQHLTDDMKPTVDEVLDMLTGFEEYKGWIEKVNKSHRNYTKRHFDTKKVDSHYAIIPTNQYPKNINDREKAVYDLIAKSVIRIIFNQAILENTSIELNIGDEIFETKGSVVKDAQWMQVDAMPNASDLLPALELNEEVNVSNLELTEGKTSPPNRYTDHTLLSAMVSCGTDLDDEELKKIMEESGDGGIGRESTRASIIESVVNRFCTRKGKSIIPTEKGMDLIDQLPVEDVKSAEMTANWELYLDKIAKGEASVDSFIKEIEEKTQSWCEEINKLEGVSYFKNEMKYLDKECPKCGSKVIDFPWGYSCEKNKKNNPECSFFIPKEFCGKKITNKQIKDIMEGKTTDWIDNLKSKKGNIFSARFKLDEENNFSLSFESDYICPKCEKPFSRGKTNYYCRTEGCNFSVPHEICDKKLTKKNINDLLDKGETDLIKGFISKKGKSFDAKLELKDGRINFKFNS